MKAFIDVQMRIPHHVYIPEEDKVYKVTSLIEFLKDKEIKEVYVEEMDSELMNQLLYNGIKIYHLRIKNHREWRKKYGLKKSHENDARLLYLIHKDHPEYFREYTPRQLPKDPDIEKYILILREMKKTKQMIILNERKGLPVEHLREYERELNRLQFKLYCNLKKKYSFIFEKFNDIKGLAGGNLLYFLTLIPRIDSFKSARSFLVYLGLRAVYDGRNNYNRKARQVLISIAIRVAQYNSIKFNPRKPNWKFIRQLAILIYTRLRGSGVDR